MLYNIEGLLISRFETLKDPDKTLIQNIFFYTSTAGK